MSLDGDPDPYIVTHAWRLEPGAGASQGLADAIVDAFISNMDDGVPLAGRFLGGTVRFGAAPFGPTFEVSRNVQGLAGTVGMAPPNCAKLVQKRTGLGGRANRGRLFLPFVVEVNVNDQGDMTSAYANAEQNRVTNWVVATNSLGDIASAVVLHNNPAIAPTDVISHVLQVRVATQRRRLR
jgi:hypothetical protein